jgi:choline dehydrogenase
VLGPVCEFNVPAAPERYARIAVALGVDTSGMDIDQSAYAGVEALGLLVDDVGIPTMAELGFSEDEIPMLAQIAFDDPQTLGNPRVLTVDDYVGIYTRAF